MKLLLTSAGIRNQNIAAALADLVGKPVAETKVAFIPTAANFETSNKDWFIAQFTDLQHFGLTLIDIVDPSADGLEWQKRLNVADVILIGGGNTFHLLNQVRKTGLDKWLVSALQSKVYVGISAGSIIVTPSIAIASVDNGDENVVGLEDLTGLNLVDFEISPHTPEDVSLKANEEYAKTIKRKLYALDNETAVKVSDGALEFVGSGKHWEFN